MQWGFVNRNYRILFEQELDTRRFLQEQKDTPDLPPNNIEIDTTLCESEGE